MYLQYGSYRHAENEAAYTILVNEIENESGQLYTLRHTWNITGQVHAADTAALLVQLRLLEAAYTVWGRDLAFFDDAGRVCHALPNAGSFTGVKITSFGYPNGSGAQLSTFRDYAITATADYPAGAGGGSGLRAFQETLSFRGGGPERAVVEVVNGPPQEQLLKAYTTCSATQSGSAVGRFGYPVVPPPAFPGKERVASVPPGNPVYGSPKFVNGQYTDFPVSWSYEFVSGTPLVGLPNRWPAG